VDASEERRELYNGFGETFSRAIEFVATPAIFAFLGHLIDRWVGTANVFAILLASLAMVGVFLRFWFAYAEAMKAEEAKAPWRKR
jgi:F0F1-type ATP synthase assembly protein I